MNAHQPDVFSQGVRYPVSYTRALTYTSSSLQVVTQFTDLLLWASSWDDQWRQPSPFWQPERPIWNPWPASWTWRVAIIFSVLSLESIVAGCLPTYVAYYCGSW